MPAKRYVRGSEPGITLAACNHRRASRRRPHRHVDVDAQVRGQVPHPPILRRGRSAITLSRGSVALRPSWTHPRIHPKLRRLTRKYRCLGGIPCAVKSLKVKVRCRLTRKRSLVRIQSCLPYFSITYGQASKNAIRFRYVGSQAAFSVALPLAILERSRRTSTTRL